ncbi:hypothetical protein F443_21121 [Phytophthora nicotianae P1569]|uniref:Uncharacterized protein n=1 Tax=Phytophthora nicotianae P1569 TaxID=1317065 RepID=V9DZ76_PHYNI|nr:hypothetical protein F443_21121 [Phytophthora nicotianae P1569]
MKTTGLLDKCLGGYNCGCIVGDDIATVCTDLSAIGTQSVQLNSQDWSDKLNDEQLSSALQKSQVL